MQAGILFQRGTTFRGKTGTIVEGVYGDSVQSEGQIIEMPSQGATASSGVIAQLLARKKQVLVCARNTSGVTMYKGLGITWASGYPFKRFDGYTILDDGRCDGVIDDQLSSSGVRDDDMCWVHIGGPCEVTTAADAADISVGDRLVCVTAATSTASTTAGKFDKAVTTFTTTNLITNGTVYGRLMNNIGIAMEAETVTNSGVVVDLSLYGQG